MYNCKTCSSTLELYTIQSFDYIVTIGICPICKSGVGPNDLIQTKEFNAFKKNLQELENQATKIEI